MWRIRKGKLKDRRKAAGIQNQPLRPLAALAQTRKAFATSDRLAAFQHQARQFLSTARDQTGILIGFHPDLCGEVKLRNCTFLRSGLDEQPVESAPLGRFLPDRYQRNCERKSKVEQS